MNPMQHTGATMTSGEWRTALAQLCQDSAMAEPGEEGAMLRQGHALLSSQPAPRSCVADHLPPAARFEALLAAGAHDSAAFALVPGTGSYIISRAREGGCIASVMLPGMEEEMTSEAESPALALVSALAAALATCGESCVASCKARVAASHDAPTDGLDESVADDAVWQRPLGALLH